MDSSVTRKYRLLPEAPEGDRASKHRLSAREWLTQIQSSRRGVFSRAAAACPGAKSHLDRPHAAGGAGRPELPRHGPVTVVTRAGDHRDGRATNRDGAPPDRNGPGCCRGETCSVATPGPAAPENQAFLPVHPAFRRSVPTSRGTTTGDPSRPRTNVGTVRSEPTYIPRRAISGYQRPPDGLC